MLMDLYIRIGNKMVSEADGQTELSNLIVSMGGKPPPRQMFDMSKIGDLFKKYGDFVGSAAMKPEYLRRWKSMLEQRINDMSPEERKE